jgi:hypothetical protein
VARPAASSPDGDDRFAEALARLRRAGAGLPEVCEGTWHGTPALKADGRSLCRVKDAETLALLCPIEDKAFLMEAAPEIYFETDHYKGWPAILVRVHAISDAELAGRLRIALAMKGPKPGARRRRKSG